MEMQPLQTSIHAFHCDHNAQFIQFSGWQMPFRYKPKGVIAEHHFVRERAGLFDVSHMGQFFVSGSGAEEFLDFACASNITALPLGYGAYTVLCYPAGGAVDDLYVYRLEQDKFLLCVNASRVDADYSWLQGLASASGASYKGLSLDNQATDWSQLALQGPLSLDILSALSRRQDSFKCLENLRFSQISALQMEGQTLYGARTGYTGEKGFEFYVPNQLSEKLWRLLFEVADEEKLDLAPIGLGARDTLRLESCYCLYGNELSEDISPLEAGLGWLVDFNKPDFVGKKALLTQKKSADHRRSVAIRLEEKGVVRAGMKVFDSSGAQIGEFTSAGVLPTLGGAGGLALVAPNMVKVGSPVFVELRGEMKKGVVTKRPFYPSQAK